MNLLFRFLPAHTASVVALNIGSDEAERMRNLATYRRMKATLHTNHSGEWALIHAGELICLKTSFDEIIQVIKAKNLDGDPCLVFQIGEKLQKRVQRENV